MKAVKRFWSAGARDADARLAAVLAPPPFESADRYLRSSAIVAAVDRATVALERWWQASRTRQLTAVCADTLRRMPPARRWRGLAIALLVGVVVHLALTMIQGRRPGWFWLIVPAMTALFAVILIAGARSQQQP